MRPAQDRSCGESPVVEPDAEIVAAGTGGYLRLRWVTTLACCGTDQDIPEIGLLGLRRNLRHRHATPQPDAQQRVPTRWPGGRP